MLRSPLTPASVFSLFVPRNTNPKEGNDSNVSTYVNHMWLPVRLVAGTGLSLSLPMGPVSSSSINGLFVDSDNPRGTP